MTVSEKILAIKECFHQIELFENNEKEQEMKDLMKELLTQLANNFDEEGRKIRGELFRLSEEHKRLFFLSLVIIIIDEIHILMEVNNLPSTKMEAMEYDFEKINTKLLDILKKHIEKDGEIRLLNTKIEHDLTQDEIKATLLASFDLLQFNTTKPLKDLRDINDLILILSIIRRLANDLNNQDYFYNAFGNVLDKLSQSSFFQIARDLSEEALLISVQQNILFQGYFIQFKVFNSHKIANEASLYLALTLIGLHKKEISKEFYENLFINIHRFFRNFNLIDYANLIYQFVLSLPDLGPYQLTSIQCSHYSMQFVKNDPGLIVEIYNSLNMYREFIIEQNKMTALPWLSVIYNAYHVFGNNPNIHLLENYKKIFESIVGPEESNKLKAFAIGEGENLTELFIDNLKKHGQTRYSSDFVGEIHDSLVLANKLIVHSYIKNDPNAFILAMILKSDFSMVFIEKDVYSEFRKIEAYTEKDEYINQYLSYSEIIKEFLTAFSNISFVWLASTDTDIFMLEFANGNYQKITKLDLYTLEKQRKWLSEKSNLLSFNETKIVNGQVTMSFEEDQLKELNLLRESLEFTTLNSILFNQICLFRDIELCELPFNLLLDSKKEFLGKNLFLVDAISIEYFQREHKPIILPSDLKISSWIPIEEEDFTLNLLNSKLEPLFQKYKIETNTETIPDKPIIADISILIAHGNENIYDLEPFYSSASSAVTDIKTIIDKTEVLILFVCHSGVNKKDLIQSRINSMVRKILASGVKTVIAPYWSLHISVPPVWLEGFFDSFSSGSNVSEANWYANNRVFEMNKNPGAWCCLHCYGNPNVKLESSSGHNSSHTIKSS